jgi:hypothetical protein
MKAFLIRATSFPFVGKFAANGLQSPCKSLIFHSAVNDRFEENSRIFNERPEPTNLGASGSSLL